MATTNYSFTQPTIGGSNNIWGAQLNAALEEVDGALFAVDGRVDALEARRLPTADGEIVSGGPAGQLFYRYGTPTPVNYRIPHIFSIGTTDPTGVGASQAGALFLVY
jgi:hypothetical protein